MNVLLSVCLSVCLSVFVSVCLSFCLSVYRPVVFSLLSAPLAMLFVPRSLHVLSALVGGSGEEDCLLLGHQPYKWAYAATHALWG